jgi:ATP/maltotriose-dependent transcriptional regulator MalT
MYLIEALRRVDERIGTRAMALVRAAPSLPAESIIASCEQPPLELARLRALGQLAELGVDDLRFTTAEARELLERAIDRRLEADALGNLMDPTEGWVTGPSSCRLVPLRLAQVSTHTVKKHVNLKWLPIRPMTTRWTVDRVVT